MLLAADGIVVALPSVGAGSAILPTAASASNTGGTPRQPEKTLRQLFDLFTNDPAKNRARRTQLAHESLFALVGEIWGLDTPIRSIDREACRQLLETLRWLPSNATKRFPKLSTLQAARMAKEKKLATTLRATTVNAYMNILRTMFNCAVNEGYIERNPAKGLRLIDPVRKRDKRLPFSTAQLQGIFNAPLYRGCVNDGAGYADVGSNVIRRSRFFTPLIGLYAGMRLNEILQLDLADIKSIDGIDCFVISSQSANGGTDKKLKTSNSERLVPIHPVLVSCGLLDYVADRRRGGGTKLFDELQLGSTGYYSDSYSKWFRRFLERAGATRAKTCFHSFRHCFRDALRDARTITHEVGLALGGWASASGREGVETAESYGRGFRVPTLYEAIKQVEYPDLDLSHLKTTISPPEAG